MSGCDSYGQEKLRKGKEKIIGRKNIRILKCLIFILKYEFRSFAIRTALQSKSNLENYRITKSEYFGLEETFKGHPVQISAMSRDIFN